MLLQQMLPPTVSSPLFSDLGCPLMIGKSDSGQRSNEKLSESQKGRDIVPFGSSIEGVRFVGLGSVNIYSIVAFFGLYEPSRVAQAINHGRSKDIGRCSG